MEHEARKEFSKELLIKAREESFKEHGIYSPISSGTAIEDKERLMAFHNFFNKRFKKMFASLVNESLGGEMSQEFLDKFTFCYWDSDEANACCWPKELPDGRIYVAITRGMIDLCETEGELMGIVGHEIGHHIHRLMKPYGNNEVEEQGSDAIAMIHMPNAGYHPREMISIFEKMREKYPNKREEQGRAVTIDDLLDPHPDMQTRGNFNKLYVQKDDHRYAHLHEIPLDKTDIALDGLMPMDSALKIDEDFVLSTVVGGQKRQEEFKKILDDAKALQVPLISAYEVEDGRLEKIWDWIIGEYLAGRENTKGIDLRHEENTDANVWTIDILNRVYWKKLAELNAVMVTDELLVPLWDKMTQTEGGKKHKSDFYKLECSMLNRFLMQKNGSYQTYFSKKTQYDSSIDEYVIVDINNLDDYFKWEGEREAYMPSEIVEARTYIKELLENPEKISLSIIPPEVVSQRDEEKLQDYVAASNTETEEERQQNEKLRNLLGRVSRMVESGYLSYKCAGYLLNPIIEVHEGQSHPLYQLTHASKKYTSKDWQENQFLENVNPIKRLMSTLGYYDSQTYELGSTIYNLLLADAQMWHSHLGINKQDIQNMDDDSLFVVSNSNSNLLCRYDNETGKIVTIKPSNYSCREDTIGCKCYDTHNKKFTGSSFNTAQDQMGGVVKSHHDRLYLRKTLSLNTKMHFKLKEIARSFGEDNLRAEQVFDIVNFSNYYIKCGTTLSFDKKNPFVLEGMDWPYNMKDKTSVLEEYIPSDVPQADREKSKNSKDYLFDYLDEWRNSEETQAIYLNIANGYLQLLERGLTDSQVAEQVIQASFYKEINGKVFPIYTNPALFVLNPEVDYLKMGKKSEYGKTNRMSWHKYVETYFQRRVLSVLNQSPYVDIIDEQVEFKSQIRFGRSGKIIEQDSYGLFKDMYEVAPALCAKVFALYEEDENGNRTYMDLPIKTYADLRKMKELYGHYVNRHYGVSNKPIDIIIKIAHDKYLLEGHTDIPMDLSIDIVEKAYYANEYPLRADTIPETQIDLLHGYVDNVSNIENWPKTTERAIRLIARHPDYALNGDGVSVLSSIVPQSIIQDYQNMILSAPTFEAKLSLLSYAVDKRSDWSRYEWNLSQETTCQLLDVSDEKTIWGNSVDDNIKLYLWLNDRKAFEHNLALQMRVAEHLISQLERVSSEKKEEYSFLLLSKRADIPSPANKQRLMNMWVKSVAELVGLKDDMSDEYLKKVQPYIHKLHNKRKASEDTKPERRETSRFVYRKEHEKKNKRNKKVSRYIYTELEMETKRELGKMLQDSLVSQPKLSAILQPEEHIGLASDQDKTGALGKAIKVLSIISRPSDAIATIDFLLETPTAKSVKKWSSQVAEVVKGYMPALKNKEISYEAGKNFHDEFWSKDFIVRLASLTELFSRAYPDSHRSHSDDLEQNKDEKQELASKERIENMLNRILAPNIENREAFYAALYNYATAVNEKEMYKADSLLAGCLASAPKDPNNQMNLGETIRKFLESQGAAGIKVGQFLSAHEDIPAEVRTELKKLTNHASTPSRHDVFEIIREKHPELMSLVMQNGGLGKCLGAASHYLTYEMGDKVVSISRPESATKASVVYNRLLTAIGKTLKEQPQNAHLLHVIRDAVTQAHSMNDVELNGNIGYEQSLLATKLYDNVEMEIDGHAFTFKTMPWVKPNEKTGPYHMRVQDISGYEYSQSFKIMEKASGIDYDKIQDPTYKKAVAKANFLLNLRMILKGDVFDDDRHTGQLKVERMSDNSTRINLFDTGSMSTEPPTNEELNSFGQALHATSRAIMALQSDSTQEQKINTLHRVFPSAKAFDNLFDENGNTSPSALTVCFNLAVNELRNEEGYAPLYISKVERSLANLSHFSNDIPSDEMLPLVSNLVQNTGNIHPEIIRGMGKDTFILDHLIMQKILPNGKLNTDFIDKTICPNKENHIDLNFENTPDEKVGKGVTTTGSTQYEKSDNPFIFSKTDIMFNSVASQTDNMAKQQTITGRMDAEGVVLSFDTIKQGLDDLLRPTDITNNADKKSYDETLVDMCFPPADISFIDHMNDTLNRMPNPKIRQKLAKKMVNLMHNMAKNMQKGKQADAISKEIFGYLTKTGIPYRLINKIAKRLPFKRAIMLRLALLRRGRLTFGKKTVMQALSQNITQSVQAWNTLDEQKRQALVSNDRLIVREVADITKSPLLAGLVTGKGFESASNKFMTVMAEAYTPNVREIKERKTTQRRNEDKQFQQPKSHLEETSILAPQIKLYGKIGNLFKRLSSFEQGKSVVTDACAFRRGDIDIIRRKKGRDGK